MISKMTDYLDELKKGLPEEEREGAYDALTQVTPEQHHAFEAGVERAVDAIEWWGTRAGIVAELPLPADECFEGEDGSPEVWWERGADIDMNVSVRCTELRVSHDGFVAQFKVCTGARWMEPALARAWALEVLAAARIAELGGLDAFLDSLPESQRRKIGDAIALRDSRKSR